MQRGVKMVDKIKKTSPSMDEWLKEAKQDSKASQVGMYLFHNGVVRETPKAQARQGIDDGSVVVRMVFAYDEAKVQAVIDETKKLHGIHYVRVWLNEGILELGDDIMFVLIGGDIRPRVIDALQYCVGRIKNECVVEIEERA